MYQDSRIDMDELANNNREQQHSLHQQHTGFMAPLCTIIENSCNRIKKELETIQASNQTLMNDYDRLILDKNDLEKKLQVVTDRSCFFFMEMSRHREVADRYENILTRLLPFLPADKHKELSDSIYHAKHFTKDDFRMFAEQRVSNGLVPMADNNIQLGGSSEYKFNDINNVQSSLASMLLQFVLFNSSQPNSNNGLPNIEELAQNQVPNNVPQMKSITSTNDDIKKPALKRKRTDRRKIQPPVNNSSTRPDKHSCVLRQTSQFYGEDLGSDQKSLSQPQRKPEPLRNSQSKIPSTQKVLKQKRISEFLNNLKS